MQSTTRRSSVPATVSTRKTSTTTSSTVKTRQAVQKQSSTDNTTSLTSTSPISQPSTSTVNTSSVNVNPVVLTPVSQLPKGTRRNSRAELTSDKPTSWDPEHFNPDGSLRTVHRMPGFEQAYAQAQKARYIRHRNVTEKEKELSVNQIFDKS